MRERRFDGRVASRSMVAMAKEKVAEAKELIEDQEVIAIEEAERILESRDIRQLHENIREYFKDTAEIKLIEAVCLIEDYFRARGLDMHQMLRMFKKYKEFKEREYRDF